MVDKSMVDRIYLLNTMPHIVLWTIDDGLLTFESNCSKDNRRWTIDLESTVSTSIINNRQWTIKTIVRNPQTDKKSL